VTPRAPKKSKEEIVTAAEQLIERGRKQGIEKGIEKGQRSLILEQLSARFGTLPEAIAGRVRAADPAQLKRWALRVVTAASLPRCSPRREARAPEREGNRPASSIQAGGNVAGAAAPIVAPGNRGSAASPE
jgi:hypothetical protein